MRKPPAIVKPPFRKAVAFVGGADMLHGYYRLSMFKLECGHIEYRARGRGFPARLRCDQCGEAQRQAAAKRRKP